MLKKQSLVVSKVEENDIIDILQYADMEKLFEIQTEGLGWLDTVQHFFKESGIEVFSCCVV